VVIENKPGAGGTVGAAGVAKGAADGYTLLVHSAGHVANASMYANLPYDTINDFACVTTLVHLPNVIVVAPSKGFKDLDDLVKRAKANPNALSFATAGVGSATHMNTEIFRAAAQFDALHVPFKGTPDALTEVIAGRIDFFFAPLGAAVQLIREKKLQALAVGSSKRSPALPDVPTTVELGYRESDYLFWIALLAPSATPRPIVDRLNGSALKALALPDVKDKLATLGAETMPMSPRECDQFIRAEAVRAEAIIKKAGIKAQ
jgi:tripartite-type tricarboxylate transporter receptor subunit TctC